MRFWPEVILVINILLCWYTCLKTCKYCCRLLVIPIGRWLGVKVRRPYNLQPNPVLEEAYRRKTGKDDKKLTTVNYIYNCTTYRYYIQCIMTLQSAAQPSIRGSLSKKDRQRWQKTYYGKLYIQLYYIQILYTVYHDLTICSPTQY